MVGNKQIVEPGDRAQIIRAHVDELYQDTDFISAVFDELPGYAIIAADFDGNLLAFNKGAENMYGYTRREAVGKLEFAALFPPTFSNGGDLQQLIDSLMNIGYTHFTTQSQRRSGEEFTAHGHMSLIHSKHGEDKGIVAVIEDISVIKFELDRLKLSSRKPGRVTGAIYGEPSLREFNADTFRQVCGRYLEILEATIEQELYRVTGSTREPLHELADTLGFLHASSHDVVDLHTEAIKIGMDSEPNWPERAYVEVGRIVVLQLIGFLLEYYRKNVRPEPGQ